MKKKTSDIPYVDLVDVRFIKDREMTKQDSIQCQFVHQWFNHVKRFNIVQLDNFQLSGVFLWIILVATRV